MIEIRVPGDKSISHRALIFAALADGTSRIGAVLRSHDTDSTASVLRAYGVQLPQLSERVNVPGVGLHGFRAPAVSLDCGNSGTSARLLSGVAAALPFDSRFVGDASLSRRPMRRLTRLLEQMGARFTFQGGDGLPLTVHGGALKGIDYLNESGSAQIKSALLLAGLVSGAQVTVRERNASRDHTEVMLAAMGASITREPGAVTLNRTERLNPVEVEIPADPSSAAFLAAYAAMVAGVPIRLLALCLNPTRLGFFGVLSRMGARVSLMPQAQKSSIGEIVGNVDVKAGELRGASVEAAEVPSLVDELPMLACLAARANGETVVRGAAELRVKESDRIAAIVSNLRAVGAEAEELDDGFVVRGNERPLAGRIATLGDHRIAMAFGVLGAVPGNNIEVDDPRCVAVSYPDFWEHLGRLRREVGAQ